VISPGLRIGRYEIGRRLGKGGFGVVHVARDVDLDREIAIKVLKPEYLVKPQIVQRFLQEARAAAKIGHPGIVTVFECGQIQGTGTRADGNAYIAMELLIGESLADRVMSGGRMASQKAIPLALQLAAGLGAAHDARLVHRDRSPDIV
jgi:serine/threonine-protein kinase